MKQIVDFDNYSESYDETLNRGLVSISGEPLDYYAQMRMEYVKKYTQRIGKEIASIIELGCGTGNNIVFLRKYFPHSQITGLDISEESLATARERFGNDPRIKLEKISKQNIPGQVDLIFINGVFHHIPKEEHIENLEYIKSCLKQGALLALFENNPFNPGTRWVMKKVPFDKDAVMINPYKFLRQIRSLNFKDAELKFHFIFPKIFSFLRFMEPHCENLPIGAQYCVLAFKR